MKKPAIIIGTLVIVILILSIVRIYVFNTISTSGVAFGKIEEEISYYKMQNLQISEKVYTASALTNIAAEAEKLGYTYQQSEFVLNGQVPIAKK